MDVYKKLAQSHTGRRGIYPTIYSGITSLVTRDKMPGVAGGDRDP